MGDHLGRLVGARLSASVLVGGVALLIAAALSPFVVSRLFRGNSDTDSGKQETAQRPEAPIVEAPPLPRRSEVSAALDSRQNAQGRTASLPGNERQPGLPAAANAQADSPALNRSPSWSSQASPNMVTAPSGRVPWQTSPDAPRGGSLVDRAAEGPSPIQGESGVVYRAPRVGGLVNAMPPSAREPSAAEPPPEYRTATRPRYADDPRSSMLNDRRMGYPETTPTTPYPAVGPTGVEIPRDPGQSPGYRDSVSPSGYSGRGPSATYDSAYPGRSPASGYEPGYPNRGLVSDYEPGYPNRGAAPSGRPATGTWPGSPAAANPGWAPPQTALPGASSPPSYPTTSAPAYPPPGYPASGYPVSGYPASGYSGPQTWPSANYVLGQGGENAAPTVDYEAAQLEGTIEKPTARTSYERTRPSIR